MQQANMLEAITFDDETVVVSELFETPFSKEIRIAMQGHQVMRDHLSTYPITLSVLRGMVRLSMEEDEAVLLKEGELVALDGGVKHHLEALQESVLHLSLFLKES